MAKLFHRSIEIHKGINDSYNSLSELDRRLDELKHALRINNEGSLVGEILKWRYKQQPCRYIIVKQEPFTIAHLDIPDHGKIKDQTIERLTIDDAKEKLGIKPKKDVYGKIWSQALREYTRKREAIWIPDGDDHCVSPEPMFHYFPDNPVGFRVPHQEDAEDSTENNTEINMTSTQRVLDQFSEILNGDFNVSETLINIATAMQEIGCDAEPQEEIEVSSPALLDLCDSGNIDHIPAGECITAFNVDPEEDDGGEIEMPF